PRTGRRRTRLCLAARVDPVPRRCASHRHGCTRRVRWPYVPGGEAPADLHRSRDVRTGAARRAPPSATGRRFGRSDGPLILTKSFLDTIWRVAREVSVGRLVKFTVVGVSIAVFYYFSAVLMVDRGGLQPALANSFVFMASAVLSYALQTLWTFESRF